MKKVTASEQIVGISYDTSLNLNMWARIIKWIILIPAIIMGIIGIELSVYNEYTFLPGILLILFAAVNVFISFFTVYMLRAIVIVTEACSIYVLEHRGGEENE